MTNREKIDSIIKQLEEMGLSRKFIIKEIFPFWYYGNEDMLDRVNDNLFLMLTGHISQQLNADIEKLQNGVLELKPFDREKNYTKLGYFIIDAMIDAGISKDFIYDNIIDDIYVNKIIGFDIYKFFDLVCRVHHRFNANIKQLLKGKFIIDTGGE